MNTTTRRIAPFIVVSSLFNGSARAQTSADPAAEALALELLTADRRVAPSNMAEVEFGVGTREPFASVGRFEYSETPGGDVATTTHWGDYANLVAAHDAVVAWCKSEGHTLAGVSWENDPAKRRTDIYQLLRDVGQGPPGLDAK